MKKFLAVVLLCLPVFGQAVYSGAGYSSGAAISSAASSGAPLTYSARTDLCVHGYPEAGCVNGATTGQTGSALVFQGWDADPVPFAQLSSGAANINNCFTDPDFGTYECFVTDQTTQNTTAGWTMGSDGGYDAFSRDGTMLKVINGGSVDYFVDIVPGRFHANTCAPSPSSAKCFVQSQIHGSANPDATHTDNAGAVAFSRVPTDPPNTMYESPVTQVYRLLITQPKDADGTPTGLDTISRTLLVDYTSDSPVPCKVLPPDYDSRWNGGFSPSVGGSFTIASAGGGSYQTRDWNTGGTGLVTADTFIMPVNNNAGIAHYMFQASDGQTSGTEPNWAVNCPAKGSTCTDGAVTWTNIGVVNGQGPGFDVLAYDPSTGCSRVNTRLGKIYRGTGNPDPAGPWLTDDWLTCDRLANVSVPGTGTRPCHFRDTFTLHATSQQMDSNYATMGATGAGGGNADGSCPDSGMKLNPGTGSGKWAAGTSYAYHDLVFGSDGNWYIKKSSGTSSSTGDPTTDTTNWQNDNNYCYGYIWTKHTLLVHPLIGMSAPAGVSGGGYSTDGHNVGGYKNTYRGGKYFAHSYAKPVCDAVDNPSGCLYEGAANPGQNLMSASLCSDAHPSPRNFGTQDLEPVPVPTASVPMWPTNYTCGSYNEEVGVSNLVIYRWGHNFNTGSEAGFSQNAIGVSSQQGDMLAWGSNFMNSRGDFTGATTCVNKLRAMYQPDTLHAVAYLDTMMPLATGDIYKAVGCPGQGGTTTCTEAATLPVWNTVCPNAGDYCTSDKTATGTILDGNVLWLNQGQNSCRVDVAVMDLLSAHAAP